jgi:beta-N-acetylhexosaminidase
MADGGEAKTGRNPPDGGPPSRGRLWLRRIVALVLTGAATGLAAGLLFGGGSSGGGRSADIPSGVPAPARRLVARMSLEQKVDQVLALGFEGSDSSSPVFGELSRHQLGGVYVGSGNWTDSAQGTALVSELRTAGSAHGRIPPLLMTAQGGGGDNALPGMPPAQSEPEVGARADPKDAEAWAKQAGQALRSAGIDLNIGIDADIGNPGGPAAGHAFSTNPSIVTAEVVGAMIGCREAKIACAVAHFPGLGAASADTDLGPATVQEDAATLIGNDVSPFRAAIHAGVAAVVLSHAYYAAYDPISPASQTPLITEGLLRGSAGFRGVAITDDLDTGAIKAVSNIPSAAVASLRGGADLVLIESPGAAQDSARRAILAAVRQGTLPQARLAEAAGRVVELKRKLGTL